MITSDSVINGNGASFARSGSNMRYFHVASGGGIANYGLLTLNAVSSAANGGGIYNASGSIALNRSTISGSSGVLNAGTMTLLNSTISSSSGFGLESSGSTDVSFTTIVLNGGGGYNNVSACDVRSFERQP